MGGKMLTVRKLFSSLLFIAAATLFLITTDPFRSAFADTPVEVQGGPEFLSGGPTGRGYITHRMESAPGGAYLTVEVVQDRSHSPVKLRLAFDGTSSSPGRPNLLLTRGVSNPSGYRTKFEFYLDYEKLRAWASAKGVTNAAERIAPNKTMVVIANFPSGHRWGGTDRSGMFRLPRPSASQSTSAAPASVADSATLPAFGEGSPATSLDVGQVIDSPLADEFAPLRGRGGLEVGGQIRSRVEAEGKFQLSEAEFLNIQRALFQLASNRRLARTVLGTEWSLEVVTRYMKKDSNGNVIHDSSGFPVPDPMIDTYYDTDNLDAARHDIAIRYRWTAGNRTGTWNFKPGLGRRSEDGIVYRVEYGVDAVDDRPESIEVFANSNHPLNPFQLLREIVPGVSPGRFFKPALKITDDRYKFALKHRSGIIIEVSLDRVLAQRLGRATDARVTFYQLEMDIEHIATESLNEVSTSLTLNSPNSGSSNPDTPTSPYTTLHIPADVEQGSPTLEAQQATFELATVVIRALRDHLLGQHWRPGAQKYAFAAAALGAIHPSNVSRSVSELGFSKGKCAGLLESE